MHQRVAVATTALAVWLPLIIGSLVYADAPALLELSRGDETYLGKLVAHDDRTCWLMGRDGRLEQLSLHEISRFREADSRFRPFTAAEMRDRLRSEFGREFEVAGTEHYLVCAAPGKAVGYARIFEELYRMFRRSFSARGFKLADPEFPLVAVVFRKPAEFARCCQQDGVTGSRGLMGYYHPRSNRVALIDDGDEANLRATIIHEATHQSAFNTGLHSRMGETPQWVVEGLALVFEPPAARDGSHRSDVKSRMNRERFVWFGNYRQDRRGSKSLAAFLAADKPFQTATLDSYSEAWALSFYLLETRPFEYARYLKIVAARDPLKEYEAEDRLRDFQSAFGADIDWLEVEYLRFIERLPGGR